MYGCMKMNAHTKQKEMCPALLRSNEVPRAGPLLLTQKRRLSQTTVRRVRTHLHRIEQFRIVPLDKECCNGRTRTRFRSPEQIL